MVRSRVAVLAVIVSSFGCSYLSYLPWVSSPQWQIARSKRFTAYLREGAQPAATLVALEQSYAMLEASLFKNRAITPVEVLLLDWPELRGALGSQRTGASIAELPGKGPQARQGLIVMYGQDTTTAGAVHRLTHLFINAWAPGAPLWLHEGLASHLERAVYREGPPEATVCLGQLPQKQSEIPVTELFAWSWTAFDDAGGKEAKRVSAYRYTASNLVDYLLMGEGGKLRDKLGELLDAVADGTGSEAAFTKVYPALTASVLQQKLGEHRRAAEGAPRGLCPLPFTMATESFADSAKAKLVPAPTGEASGGVDQLLERVRMLPRREGHVDWYPAPMVGIEGGQFAPPAPAAAPAGTAAKPAPAGTAAKPAPAGTAAPRTPAPAPPAAPAAKGKR